MCTTRPVIGVQDQSLVAGGDAFGSAEVERAAVVGVEDAQVVVGVGGHADEVGDGQQGAAGGDGDSGGGVQLVEGGGDDDHRL
jgi:hypothetical protein